MPLRRIWIAVVALTLLTTASASATSNLSQKAGSAGCVT